MSIVSNTTIQDDLMELARLKERQKDLAEEVLEMESVIIAALEKKDQKTVSANNGDLKGTLVKGSTITVDEEALKKALGASVWAKVTRSVLDKEKLEAMIVAGQIDPNVVAQHSTEKDRKPFIKVSGSWRTRKKPQPTTTRGAVTTTNSKGNKKPAAKKRVVRPKK